MGKNLKGLTGLAAVVATIMLASGCQPFAYFRLNAPQAKKPRPGPKSMAVMSARRGPSIERECVSYATDAAASLDPNGSRLAVCSSTDQSRPRGEHKQVDDVFYLFETKQTKEDMENLVEKLYNALKALDTRTVFKRQKQDDGTINVKAFSLDNEGSKRYFIACYFSGKPGDISGSCVMDDAKGKEMDAIPDWIYKGPERSAKQKKGIVNCLIKRGKKGNLAACIPFKKAPDTQKHYRVAGKSRKYR